MQRRHDGLLFRTLTGLLAAALLLGPVPARADEDEDSPGQTAGEGDETPDDPADTADDASGEAPATDDDSLMEAARAEPGSAAPSPADRPISGFWKGRHRITLGAGYHYGNTVRDAGILAAPVTGQPGTRRFPAATPLQVELQDSPIFGVQYGWFAGDGWGIQVGLDSLSSTIRDPDPADLAALAVRLDNTNLVPPQPAILLARLAAHQAPHDFKVTFLDIGAFHVFTPKKRLSTEVGGGVGWAFASLDGPVAYERLVVSDAIAQGSVQVVANDVLDPAPPHGQCLADNDPCIEVSAQGGLTWHAWLATGFSFNRNVMLQLGAKLRYVQHLVDPGDSNVMKQVTLGVSFRFGGE